MKRLLMTLIVVSVFMAASAQAANGKMYFSGSAGLSITDDLDFPGINISFSPGFNVGGLTTPLLPGLEIPLVEVFAE